MLRSFCMCTESKSDCGIFILAFCLTKKDGGTFIIALRQSENLHLNRSRKKDFHRNNYKDQNEEILCHLDHHVILISWTLANTIIGKMHDSGLQTLILSQHYPST